MRIRGGVSLDGDEEGNRHRLDRGGKSSYERTVRGIGVLGKRPGLLQGALSVIDVESDPLSTYRAIEACGFQSVDFLFPHGTWELLPPGKSGDDRSPLATAPSAEWLLAIYEIWSDAAGRMLVSLFGKLTPLTRGGGRRA